MSCWPSCTWIRILNLDPDPYLDHWPKWIRIPFRYHKTALECWLLLGPVLGIRDILVRIRIRILGSIPLYLFSYFFVLELTHRHIIFILKKIIFAKLFCKNFILQALFQSAQHFYETREGSGSGARSLSVPLNNGSGSGWPKNMLIRFQIQIPKTG